MTDSPIPFNRPALTGKELEYIRQAVDGGVTSGDGPFTKRCEKLLEGFSPIVCPILDARQRPLFLSKPSGNTELWSRLSELPPMSAIP